MVDEEIPGGVVGGSKVPHDLLQYLANYYRGSFDFAENMCLCFIDGWRVKCGHKSMLLELPKMRNVEDILSEIKKHGEELPDALVKKFGGTLLSSQLAKTGDVVLKRIFGGSIGWACGLCVGGNAAFLGIDGAVYLVPKHSCRYFWDI